MNYIIILFQVIIYLCHILNDGLTIEVRAQVTNYIIIKRLTHSLNPIDIPRKGPPPGVSLKFIIELEILFVSDCRNRIM